MAGQLTSAIDAEDPASLRLGQGRILEMIATGAPLGQVLESLVRLIETHSPGMLGSVLLLDEDGRHVRHAAAAGLPEAYARAVDGAEIGPRAGSCGTAMYRREPVIVTDILEDPLWTDYRDLAASHGLRACWSIPIFSRQGAVLGSFAMYYREVRSPSAAEARLSEVAAQLAAIAIEGRRGEEALRASEERHRLLVDSAPFCIHEIDREGRLLSMNPAGLRMLGVADEKGIRGMQYLDAVAAPDRPRIAGLLARALEGEASSFEFTSASEDDPRVFASCFVAIRGGDGSVQRLMGISEDITQRSRAERLRTALLAISEAAHAAESLQALYLTVHEIVGGLMPARNFYIALLSPDGRSVEFPYFVDLHDPPPAPRPPGRGITDYVLRTGEPLLASPEVFAELRRRGEVELVGGESIDWLGVPLRAGGRTLGVLAVQSYEQRVRYRERDRDVLAFVSTQIAAAIERRSTEETLRQSEAILRNFFDSDSMMRGVVELVDGDILHVADNSASARFLGVSREALRNRRASELGMPRDILEIWIGHYEASARGGKPVRFEYAHTTPAGKRWLSVTVAHIGSAARVGSGPERSPRFAYVVEDVTERRALEEQLRQALKMEAVGRLAGGVAHDFNNILGVISGYGSLALKRLPEDDPLHGKVSQILKAAERAAALTRQLLAFSRQQVMQPRALDLNSVVSDMEVMLRRILGEDVELFISRGNDLGSVMADAGQIEQVIMNLAVNARDAMPEGGRLTIETRNVDIEPEQAASHPVGEAGPYVLLAVSDTGAGMDAATQARVFEPFFTTKEVGKGTGLGLSTVYGIVKQSGGYIWLYSEVGVGTAFKVYLPRIDAPAETRAAAAPAEPLRRGSETILLVEDEPGLREVLYETLSSSGYNVLTAREGAEALQVAAAHPERIHLLLTDVVMPGMTGRQAAQELTLALPGLKVLYMSGYSDEAVISHGILGPGTEFLSKPFGTEHLLRKVRELLDRG